MTLSKFFDMFDMWNQRCRLNDDNLDTIVEDEILWIHDCEDPRLKKYLSSKVISFGFYDGILMVRIDAISDVYYKLRYDEIESEVKR